MTSLPVRESLRMSLPRSELSLTDFEVTEFFAAVTAA